MARVSLDPDGRLISLLVVPGERTELGSMLLSLAVIVAPAFWGFWISQAGWPLFRDAILEPAAKR